MAKKIIFTDREQDFIRRFSATRTGHWMAVKLKVSYCTVYRFMAKENLQRLGSKKASTTIPWTDGMIAVMRNEFPITFNRVLAAKLKIGWRSLVRKARELGIEKEPRFLENRRPVISMMATEAHPPPWNKGLHYTPLWLTASQFKPGKRPNIDYKALAEKRKETIRRERLRIKYGLPRKTKIILKP